MSNKEELLRISVEGKDGSVVRVFKTAEADFLGAMEEQLNHAVKCMGYDYFEFKVVDNRPEVDLTSLGKGSKSGK